MNAIIEHINSAGYAFVEFAAAMLIQSGLLILLLLLADFALRKRVRAVFRYWIWMLVLVKLLLPTSLSGPFSLGYWLGDEIASVDVSHSTSEAQLQAGEAPVPVLPHIIDLSKVRPPIYLPSVTPLPGETDLAPAESTALPSVPAVPITWQGVVFLLWLAVAAVMLLLLGQRAIFVRGLVAQAKNANRPMLDTLDQCRKSMKIKRAVTVKISPNATSPAVCELWRPVILIPHNMPAALGSADLRVVLLHELAHIKRGDLWVNLIQTLLQILYFYNPLLWVANAVIRRSREQAVDEVVLVAMGEKARRYPQTLVSVAKLAFERPALSLRLIGVVESKSTLTARIKHILNRPMPKSAKLGALGLLAIIVAAAILLPMAKENTGDSKIVVKEYRLKHPVSQREMGALVNKISHTLKRPLFETIKALAGKGRSKTYHVQGHSTTGKIVVFANGNQHTQAAKFLRKEYGDLLRPEKLYDMSSVANIDVFADNCRKIVKDVFTWQKFMFLTDEDINYIAEDLGDFIRTYTRGDVPKEMQLRILDSLDMYLYSTFRSESIYQRERTYLRFDDRIKTLKLKLWQVIATEPLTEKERTTLTEQKQWIYDFADSIPSTTEMERIGGMLRADAVFNDILNGFSMQPMSEETFKELQKDIRAENDLNGIANQASCWSTQVARECYRQHKKAKYRWPFPFGVVTGYSGGSDRVDFDFESEEPYILKGVWVSESTSNKGFSLQVYDLASKRGLKVPDDSKTPTKLEAWIEEQGKGDVYYDRKSESIVSCRGAKMAVLNVNNWIESDRIPTEKLRDYIRTKPITSFSVSGFKSIDEHSFRHESKPVISIIAVESKSGDVALIRPHNLLDYQHGELYLKVRHRFEGWDDLWFSSFITGELKNSTKRSNATQSSNYTDRAAKVMKLAEKEARELNHAYIGTEHILLALAEQSDGVAAKVLDKLGIGTDALQGELKKLVKTGSETVTKSRLPQTPRAKKALEHARSEARALDHDYIGTEHILLGLMREKDGVAAQMLVKLGVSYDVAREEVLGFVKPGSAAESAQPFVATLPNGVMVELVGVCEHPSDGKQWWKPDGDELLEAPYDEIGGNVYPDGDEKSFEFAIRLRNLPAEHVNTKVGCEESVGGSAGGSSSPEKTGEYLSDFRWLATTFPKKLKACTVKVGVAAGQWQPVAKSNGKGFGSRGSELGGVSFTKAFEVEDGISITVADDILGRPCRVVAITNDGEVVKPVGSSGSSAGKARQTTAKFNNISLSDIREFQFQTRPYEWAEFKNVSLRPGVKSDVQVDRVGGQAAKSYRTRYFATLLVTDGGVILKGQKMSWAQLEGALKEIPNRDATVLEVAVDLAIVPEGLRGSAMLEWVSQSAGFQKAAQLHQELGFEYLSNVGVDRVSSRRGPVSVRFQDALRFGEQIPVALMSFEEQPFLRTTSIEFEKAGADIRAVLKAAVTSYPKKSWEIGVRLLDGQGKQITSVVNTFENSGNAVGYPIHSQEEMNFSFGQAANLADAKRFEVRLREYTTDLATGKPVVGDARSDIRAIIERLKSAKYVQNGKGTALVVSSDSSSSYQDASMTERIVDFRFKGNLSRSDAFTSDKGKRGEFEYSWATGPMSSAQSNRRDRATVQAEPFREFHRQVGYDFHPETFVRYHHFQLADLLERMVGQPDVTMEVAQDSQGRTRIVSQYKDKTSEEEFVMLFINAADGVRLVSWESTSRDSANNRSEASRSRLQVDWQKYAGIWYISEAISEGAGVHDGLRSEGRTSVTILDFTPNVEIEDKEFTLNGLNIRPGTTVHDSVLDTTFKYAGAKGDSAERLRRMGTAILMYANDYDDKVPDNVDQLKRFLDVDDMKWLLENVRYLGKGRSANADPEIPLAYERTMLQADQAEGTNVLFISGIVSFKTRKQLEKLGITIPPSLSWGEAVNGLRAAVEFVPDKQQYSFGEKTEVRLHIQNVSEKPIQFTSSDPVDSQAVIEDDKGRQGLAAENISSYWPIFERYHLQPGKKLVLKTGCLGITSKDNEVESPQCRWMVRARPGVYFAQFVFRLSTSGPHNTQRQPRSGEPLSLPLSENDWKGTLETGKHKLVVTGASKPNETTAGQVEVEAPSEKGELVWGEAVEGVQMWVRPERQRWYEGETPKFRVDMRNKGTVEWKLGLTQGSWEVELDGLWYRIGGVFSGWFQRLLLGPGQEHKDIEFYPGVWSEWHINGKPLKFTPGLHTVRLSFVPYAGDRANWRRLRVVSNAVVIEVLPAEADKRGWGEVVAGLQCGLRADKRVWKADETPKLQAVARNVGRDPWRLPRPSEFFFLKVAGKIWRWKGPGPGEPVELKPGEDLDKTSILLSSDLRLKLSPGKHTVQLVIIVSKPVPPEAVPGTIPVLKIPVLKQLRIESNVVVIEVLPTGEKPGTVEVEADALAALQAEFDELRRQRRDLAGAETFGKMLLEKYTEREEKSLVYYQLAEMYAQGGQINPSKVVEYAEAGWWYVHDPVKKARLFVYWGDALQLSKARRDAAKIYLRGLEFCLQFGLAKDKPELPAVGASTVDGPPEVVEEYRRRNQLEMAAWKQAKRMRELIEHRQALTGQVVQLYAREPDAFDELRELVMKYLYSEEAAEELIAAARAYRRNQKVAIPVIMRMGPDPKPDADLLWGQAAEGIRVRLRAEKAVWVTGEVPKFKLDVRNDGSHRLLLTSAPDYWGVEVDGVWYSAAIPMLGGAKGMSFGPDKQWYDLSLSLDMAVGWRSESGGLEVKPGRYTVRAALSRGLSQDGRTISLRAVSNPVEIEILPAEEKPDVQVEVRPGKLSAVTDLPNNQAEAQGNADEAKYEGRTIAEWIAQWDSKLYDETRAATEALIKIGRPAVPRLIEEVKRRSNYGWQAVGVLTKMGPEAEDAVEWLIEAALDKDLRFGDGRQSTTAYRGSVLYSLSRMTWARDRVIPVLQRVAEDGEEEAGVRRQVILALRNIGKQAMPILQKLTEVEEHSVRDAAHGALGQLLEKGEGLSKDDYYTPLIEQEPFGPSVLQYLGNAKGIVNYGRPHPLTQRIKKLYRERLAKEPDAELAWRLASIIQNGLKNTELMWAAPMDGSKGHWLREDPTENYSTLAEVLELGFRHAQADSELRRKFAVALAKLRLLQGDWDRMNAMLKELGQEQIPKESRRWLPAPPVDWAEDLRSQWKIADESMRSGNCSLEFKIEKAGKGLKGVHFLVKRAPEPTNVFSTGIRTDTLFFAPAPMKVAFGSFGYGGKDRSLTRYAVSDESGIVRFDKLPDIPVKIEVLVPTSNFPEAVSNWDLWMEVEPGKFKLAKIYGGADAVDWRYPPAVVELKEGQTVHYPKLVVRSAFGLNVRDWARVDKDNFILSWAPMDSATQAKTGRCELEMSLSAPPDHPYEATHAPVLQSAKIIVEGNRWPVGEKGVGDLHLEPGNIYMFGVRALDASGVVIARWPRIRVWTPWGHRTSDPPFASVPLFVRGDLSNRPPIHNRVWHYGSFDKGTRRRDGLREGVGRFLSDSPNTFEYEYVRMGKAWLDWHDDRQDARRQLEKLVKELPEGNVARGTALWMIQQIDQNKEPPKRLNFVPDRETSRPKTTPPSM